MQSGSNLNRPIDWRAPGSLFLVAIGIYVVSLITPAIGEWSRLGDALWGFHVLVYGWLALDGSHSNLAWLANILFVLILVAWRFKMPKTAVFLSFFGLVFALTAFEVGSLVLGAYLWLLSFAILFFASVQLFRTSALLSAF